MTVNFDSVSVEWYADGTWYDLLPDIIPGTFRGSRGTGIGMNDRLARKGTLSFQLNNSESNKAKKQGYYTPTHTNVISPFWGRPYSYPLRITFEYEGRYKVLRYTFEKPPNGVSVSPGVKGARTVTVNFRDWMGIAQEYTLDLLPSSTSKTADQAIELILAQMAASRQPQSTLLRTGDSTFATVFDDTNSGTTVYSELGKIAASEFGYIYNRADRSNGEVLTLDNRLRRYTQATTGNITGSGEAPSGSVLLETGDYLLEEASGGQVLLDATTIIATAISMSNAESGNILLETGDALLLETGDNLLYNDTESADFTSDHLYDPQSMIVKHYDLAYKSARLSIQQKDVDTSAVVLWQMAKPLFIGAGATIPNIRGRYRDPSGGSSYINASDFETLISGTDYGAWSDINGTGSNLSANISIDVESGSAETNFTITNSGAAAYITNPKLQIQGLGIYPYDSLDIVLGDDINENRLDVNSNYETDEAVVRQFANEIIKNPTGVTTIEKMKLLANKNAFNMNAWMDLDIGSMINVTEEMTNTASYNPYFVNGYDFEFFWAADGIQLFWTPNGFPYSRVFVPA